MALEGGHREREDRISQTSNRGIQIEIVDFVTRSTALWGFYGPEARQLLATRASIAPTEIGWRLATPLANKSSVPV